MTWRNRRLDPWPLRSKLCLTLLNRCRTNGTHGDEMSRIEIRNRGMANDPRDSKRKDKLIMGHRILIDIYKEEYEVRKEINRKILNKG